MDWNLFFFINCILLGVGLAMDAFSVSIANCMSHPHMSKSSIILMTGTYGLFQFLMPLTGWLCVRTVVQHSKKFQTAIPWIAFFLLLYIGLKMIWESIHEEDKQENTGRALSFGVLMVQGIATSIDALSTGFAIAQFPAEMALTASLIIAAVTFMICMGGAAIGKKLGTILARKAPILGGIILIGIGLEILAGSLFP